MVGGKGREHKFCAIRHLKISNVMPGRAGPAAFDISAILDALRQYGKAVSLISASVVFPEYRASTVHFEHCARA